MSRPHVRIPAFDPTSALAMAVCKSGKADNRKSFWKTTYLCNANGRYVDIGGLLLVDLRRSPPSILH